MSEVSDPRVWLRYAEEDYMMARSALRRKIPFGYSACFHAQQCAEKLLKAILLAKGVPFPKTHDLLLLNDLCQQAGMIVPVELKDLNILSDYAVRARYPGDEPSADDGYEAVAIARVLRRFVRKIFANT